MVLENDRIIISELVRVAIASINMGTTREALQSEVWTDEQLARIQAAREETRLPRTWFAAAFRWNAPMATLIRNDSEIEMTRPINICSHPAAELTGDETAAAAHWWQTEFVRATDLLPGLAFCSFIKTRNFIWKACNISLTIIPRAGKGRSAGTILVRSWQSAKPKFLRSLEIWRSRNNHSAHSPV